MAPTLWRIWLEGNGCLGLPGNRPGRAKKTEYAPSTLTLSQMLTDPEEAADFVQKTPRRRMAIAPHQARALTSSPVRPPAGHLT